MRYPEPPLRFREIGLVDFESDKFFHDATPRCESGISDAEKRIEHRFNASRAYRTMQLDAPLRELNRKSRRMRPLFFTALDCFVRNEPGVAATTQIASTRMRPARDIGFVLIRNSDC